MTPPRCRMLSIAAGGLMLGCALIGGIATGRGQAGPAADRPAAESADPRAVLRRAAAAMEAYRAAHGTFATEWRLLDIDRPDRPTQGNLDRWQPEGVDFVYRIATADRDDFQIVAEDWDDQIVAGIRSGMVDAVPRPRLGVRQGRLPFEVPEPLEFLPRAAAAQDAFRAKEGVFASRWDLLDVSFSAVPAHIYNLGVRPPPDAGRAWQPRGCAFTYRIVAADREHFTIQATREGNPPEYEIRDGMKRGRPLAGPGSVALR